MKYSLDSDAIINAWINYPIENFPLVWKWVESIGRDNIGGMSEVVFQELQKGGDDCFAWFQDRKQLFVYPNDDSIQAEVKRLVTEYRNFGIITGKNEGDPYVIALALVKGAAVVTNESPSNNLNGPKIPDVCREEEIRRIKFVQVITEENVMLG